MGDVSPNVASLSMIFLSCDKVRQSDIGLINNKIVKNVRNTAIEAFSKREKDFKNMLILNPGLIIFVQ